jgi:energy-coupling factor transporter transmembrane protein EcfT
MDFVSNAGDPRIRLIGLILMSLAHGVATEMEVILLSGVTATGMMLFRDAVLRYLAIIVITALFLGLLGIFAWLTTQNMKIEDLLLNLLRWLSMAAISLTIFSSLNALEFIVALKWLRIPSRIALALGVSLRFFPVIVEQASRIITIQRLRIPQYTEKARLGRFGKLVESIVPSLFVSVLRQIENISLSILVQDIERRVLEYRFIPLGRYDYALLALFVLVPLLVIVYP